MHHPETRPEPRRFHDRTAAGGHLLSLLQESDDTGFDLVLAIPRGGVPVAAPLADGLLVALDILLARKVGLPGQPELAMGAVTRVGAVWNQDVIELTNLTAEALNAEQEQALAEVKWREAAYRQGRPPASIADRAVLLVDDGLATGATMAAAVQAVQRAGARDVAVAAGVASDEAAPASLLP